MSAAILTSLTDLYGDFCFTKQLASSRAIVWSLLPADLNPLSSGNEDVHDCLSERSEPEATGIN